MKDIKKVIPDIYKLMETKEVPEGVDLEEICADFGRRCGELLLSQLKPEADRRGLRLSQIGRPDRQIYNSYHDAGSDSFGGPTYIKFLYGHVIEEMVLSLVKAAGHEVTDQQKEVKIAGITGHMDCRIDGVLVDVNYAHAEGDKTYGWLAMDKQNGTLAWLQYHEDDTDAPYSKHLDWDVEARVKHLKKLVGGTEIPALCYEPVPDGASGNMQLAPGCRFCDFKFKCFPNLKVYNYANGPRFLTHVEKEPRVGGVEVPSDF